MGIKALLVVMFTIAVSLLTVGEKHNKIKTTYNKKELKIADSKLDTIADLQNKRKIFYSIYKRYPTSVDELISSGLIQSNFKTSDKTKMIKMNADGSISIKNEAWEKLQTTKILSKTRIAESRNVKEELFANSSINRGGNIVATSSKTKSIYSSDLSTKRNQNLSHHFKNNQVSTARKMIKGKVTDDSYNIHNIKRAQLSKDTFYTKEMKGW